VDLVSFERDITIFSLICLMDKKKYVSYSKCVHLQSTFKCHILGVPYPWPGATKFNVFLLLVYEDGIIDPRWKPL